ncbi:MAG: hydroxyacid-oxoacid transhydrogenase [Terriglobia bacterium]
MSSEIAFEMVTASIRFGEGVTREVGMDLAEGKLNQVMVLTDPNLKNLPPVTGVLESLEKHKIHYRLFDQVRVEPTDESLQRAITFAQNDRFDALVAVGGGSTIDTAKAANLYSTYPTDFLDYVNPPVGKGLPVPGPLKPLIAIPTTSGTGSETTGVAIFDLARLKAKTGIAHRRLKPSLALVDPLNTITQPPRVTVSSGLDVLSHALESYTAIPYHQRPYPEKPLLRPAYQGANPISDLWSLEALRIVSKHLVRAVEDPEDRESRSQMMLAASYAGIGFGNAGVHLPHGMSYPVSGLIRNYRPPGYAVDHPMVPHGISVILNAPAVFQFTAVSCPDRHLRGAGILGADTARARPEDAGRILAERIIELMQRLNVPQGLTALGYSREDIPALVKGTLPQHRVTKLSPRAAGEEELSRLFEASMKIW